MDVHASRPGHEHRSSLNPSALQTLNARLSGARSASAEAESWAALSPDAALFSRHEYALD
jgi:hypothetical protein